MKANEHFRPSERRKAVKLLQSTQVNSSGEEEKTICVYTRTYIILVIRSLARKIHIL